MQGLLNSGMNAEAGARPQKTQDRRMPARQEGGRSASAVDMNPENAGEQRNVLVNSMLSQLYGNQLDGASRILEQSADNPAEGIGRVVSGLLGAAYKTVTDDGRTIPPGVMFQAGMMASQAVGEMADRMGIIDENADADIVEAGFMVGLGNFGRANGKQMSDEERERYGQLIDGLEEGKRMAMSGERSNGAEKPQSEEMSDAERFRQLKAQTEEAGMQVREDGGRVIAERAEQRPAGDMNRQGGIISRGGA